MSGELTTTAVETVEPVQKNGSDKIDSKDVEATGIESQILAAMRSRVTYLREKADSFTFESVRRLLEEDLGLEKYALDVHKSFVKQHLVQCLESGGSDSNSENSQETEKKDDATQVKEVAKESEEHETKKDVKEDTTGDDEKMEDSPVMGLMTEEKTPKSVAEQTREEDKKEVLQSEIKEALCKRSSYIKANSEKITMGLLRRLLEQDLKLEKYSLDPYKKFINEELDEVLQAPDAPKPSTEGKRKKPNPKVKSTTSKNLGSKENSGSDGEDDEENEEVGLKKKTAQKRKISKSEGTGKRKRETEKPTSVKKKAKHTDSQSDSDAGDSEIISDDARSQSSSEKPLKKKETATAGYGKRVEQLKAIIKSCGMSVPPSIYRKAKQAPEEKREDTLIKELKQILAKEGLSSNPSEKEIKDVKKRKEIKKELEGIDTSNIVSSSRRRSITSFVPPPKPKIAEESESDESEDSEDEEDEEEQVEEEEEGGNEDGEDEGSQSEEESNNGDDDDEENE